MKTKTHKTASSKSAKKPDGRLPVKILVGSSTQFVEEAAVPSFSNDKIVRFVNNQGQIVYDIRVKPDGSLEISGSATVFSSVQAYGPMLAIRPRVCNVVEINLSSR